jgi:hypothetical protein
MKALTLPVLILALSLAIGSRAFAAANPTANAGPDQVVAAASNSMASVTLDGSGSTDPANLPLTYTWSGGFTEGNGITTGVKPVVTLGAGVHNILLVVNNGQGGLATDVVQITVTVPADTTPPVISSVTADPATLWPPNHKYHLVTVSVSASDNVDPAPVCKIISVTSSDPSDAFGKGTPDFVITGPLTVNLRAERLGHGSGRIYTITVQCTDSSNNSSTATVTVTVSHDKGHGHGHVKGNGMTTDQTF